MPRSYNIWVLHSMTFKQEPNKPSGVICQWHWWGRGEGGKESLPHHITSANLGLYVCLAAELLYWSAIRYHQKAEDVNNNRGSVSLTRGSVSLIWLIQSTALWGGSVLLRWGESVSEFYCIQWELLWEDVPSNTALVNLSDLNWVLLGSPLTLLPGRKNPF